MQGSHLKQWNLVARPKREGGLGAVKLSRKNDSLLLKNLHKFFNRADLRWVNLIWEILQYR